MPCGLQRGGKGFPAHSILFAFYKGDPLWWCLKPVVNDLPDPFNLLMLLNPLIGCDALKWGELALSETTPLFIATQRKP